MPDGQGVLFDLGHGITDRFFVAACAYQLTRGIQLRFGRQLGSRAVAFVALAGFDLPLGRLFHILPQRSPDVITLLELSFCVSPHITFVSAGVDCFALC